ncbi:MAG TPA: 4-(cytidine 5'-diphospho)-2-C-methyl-D-erythritol kinase [Acidimicrobiales bacterium]|nr:4-(cytidine 5'-diphospho)-2-C-methyl-D-erythritol kinase [Acidimicrobiales bacterium]
MRPLGHELAHAKLTRTLRVVGRRPDGYHLLESEMVSLDLADELDLLEGDGLEVVDALAWSGTGPLPTLAVPAGRSNLVARALELVGRRAFVRLTKRIPPGAGLGGGSSDAAAVLRWAGVVDPGVAARLGADVPFCLRGGRALVRGIGEVVEPLEPIEACFLLLVPDRPAPTPAVYAAFDLVGPTPGATNDLEAAALAVEPSLARARALLEEVTGHRAALAGSGSTWYVECPDGARDAERWASELRDALAGERRRGAVVVATAVGPA